MISSSEFAHVNNPSVESTAEPTIPSTPQGNTQTSSQSGLYPSTPEQPACPSPTPSSPLTSVVNGSSEQGWVSDITENGDKGVPPLNTMPAPQSISAPVATTAMFAPAAAPALTPVDEARLQIETCQKVVDALLASQDKNNGPLVQSAMERLNNVRPCFSFHCHIVHHHTCIALVVEKEFTPPPKESHKRRGQYEAKAK